MGDELVGLAYLLISDSLVQPVRQSASEAVSQAVFAAQLSPLAAERKENKVSHFNDAGKQDTPSTPAPRANRQLRLPALN